MLLSSFQKFKIISIIPSNVKLKVCSKKTCQTDSFLAKTRSDFGASKRKCSKFKIQISRVQTVQNSKCSIKIQTTNLSWPDVVNSKIDFAIKIYIVIKFHQNVFSIFSKIFGKRDKNMFSKFTKLYFKQFSQILF